MNIAFFRDGPLKPSITGGAVRFYNLLKNIAEKESTYLFYVNRTWCDPNMFTDDKFKTLFINPEDFYNPDFLCELMRQKGIDAAYIDTPENLMLLGSQVKRNLPNVFVLYDAHDVVSTLLRRLGEPPEQIARMILMEHTIGMIADKITCVSENDRMEFMKLGIPSHKLVVIENAAEVCDLPMIQNNKNVCFIGNNYYAPNRTAVKIITEKIAPALYDCDADIIIHIVGNTPPELITCAPNIMFHGVIDDLRGILKNMTLSICPLKEGSGTRIKVLDWMAYGVPIISTSLGVEGLKVEHNKHVMVLDNIEQYAHEIRHLLNNESARTHLRLNSHKLIKEEYDWRISANKMLGVFIDKIL